MRFPVRVFNYTMTDYAKPLEYKFKATNLLVEDIELEPAPGWSTFKPSSIYAHAEVYPFKVTNEWGRFTRFELTVEGKQFFLTFCAAHHGGWALYTPLDLKAVFKKVYKGSKEIVKDIEKEDEVFRKLRFTVSAVLQYMFEHCNTNYILFSTSKTSAANNFKLILQSMEPAERLTIEEKVSHKTKSFYLCKEGEAIGVLRRLYLDFERKHATSADSIDSIVAS